MLRPNVSHCVSENEVHYNPIIHDYSKDYLTLESLEDNNTFYWNADDVNHKYSGNPISYSLDNGETWNSVSNGEIATINSGDKILLKAVNSDYKYIDGGYVRMCCFGSIGEFNAYGNILSMIYGDNFANNTMLNGAFLRFSECSIVSAENLIFPSEFGENGTIEGMFSNCANLTTAPQLPATTLTDNCYLDMFAGCTSLTTAPELPATTLTASCYTYMFGGCTSLTTAPELPATTLAQNCYNGMFSDCRSLTSEAIVPDSIDKPISGDYCSYMYCSCPITERSGNYDVSAYDCYIPK